jgi:hypothetical protein
MRAVLLTVLLTVPALAGHSRPPYCDGGQSVDGRFVVTTELKTTPAVGKTPATQEWSFTWRDTHTQQTHTGKLVGLGGLDAVFDPTHAHLFVAPDGETFAVWNPNVCAPTQPLRAKFPVDLTTPSARAWEGFAHRLVVYQKTGLVVARLDLRDFLQADDWAWLFCYGRQVYWQANYPGLTRDNAPRVGYALYRVSPDYTVLETLVGPTAEAAAQAKRKGLALPEPRRVRVDLVIGKLRASDERLPIEKTPVRPFVGELSQRGARGQAAYVPSLDPVRIAGTYRD